MAFTQIDEVSLFWMPDAAPDEAHRRSGRGDPGRAGKSSTQMRWKITMSWVNHGKSFFFL